MIRLKVDALEKNSVSVEEYLLKERRFTPRSAIKIAFSEKKILVNGKPVTRSHEIHCGDSIEIQSERIFLKQEMALLPNPYLKSEILLNSRRLILVNKQGGVNTLPLRPNELDTAMNGIAAIAPECAQPFNTKKPLEGGLVHRLDRGTSGVLACAKTQDAFDELRMNWDKTVKIYLAWVKGSFQQQGRLSVHLYHAPKSRKKMIASLNPHHGERSWTATTEILPVHFTSEHTLLMIQIFTGVTHQIRASLAFLGFHIVGDALYETQATKGSGQIHDKTLGDEITLLAKKNASELKKLSAPEPKNLPEKGFFLHAYYLKNSAIEELKSGVLAPLPTHFKA